jgi:hypothetical protein
MSQRRLTRQQVVGDADLLLDCARHQMKDELQLDASFYHAEALCNPVTSSIFCQPSVDVVFVAKVGESIGRRVLYDSAAV